MKRSSVAKATLLFYMILDEMSTFHQSAILKESHKELGKHRKRCHKGRALVFKLVRNVKLFLVALPSDGCLGQVYRFLSRPFLLRSCTSQSESALIALVPIS